MDYMHIDLITEQCIQWIKELFETPEYKNAHAVVGISGGKDSAVVAKLCVEALGRNRVYGIIIPDSEMPGLEDAIDFCDSLGIQYFVDDIYSTVNTLEKEISVYLSRDAKINIRPRIRMTVLYAYAQTLHGRVAGTSNLSEYTLGYFTKYGDNACDFNPIRNLTCTEVIQMGKYLGITDTIMNKIPSDDISGKTDEEAFGFTYQEIDEYLINNIGSDELKEFVNKRRTQSNHKRTNIPIYDIDR